MFRDQVAHLGWEVKFPVVVADPQAYLERSPVDVALLDTEIRDINLSAWEAACYSHRVPLILLNAHEIRQPTEPALKSPLQVYKPIDGVSVRTTLTLAMKQRERNLIDQAVDL